MLIFKRKRNQSFVSSSHLKSTKVLNFGGRRGGGVYSWVFENRWWGVWEFENSFLFVVFQGRRSGLGDQACISKSGASKPLGLLRRLLAQGRNLGWDFLFSLRQRNGLSEAQFQVTLKTHFSRELQFLGSFLGENQIDRVSLGHSELPSWGA